MMFFTAKKAKKVSDRETKRYRRRTYREIKYKIKEDAKQGNTSTTIGYSINDELKSLLERKGFIVAEDEWHLVKISWNKDNNETKNS